jgi:hypothetical protein
LERRENWKRMRKKKKRRRKVKKKRRRVRKRGIGRKVEGEIELNRGEIRKMKRW